MVIVVEVESVDAARKALSKFLLAEAGLICWDVIPLGPFVNWEALFASGNALDSISLFLFPVAPVWCGRKVFYENLRNTRHECNGLRYSIGYWPA